MHVPMQPEVSLLQQGRQVTHEARIDLIALITWMNAE
jgi:hypothetical protein